jgi:transcriptional regulator with XRE-family HTH domain
MTASAALQHALDRDALRRARQGARLTLEQAGDAVGKHRLTVQRYEVGKLEPSASVLAALATAYGVHPGDLFTTARPGVSADGVTRATRMVRAVPAAGAVQATSGRDTA